MASPFPSDGGGGTPAAAVDDKTKFDLNLQHGHKDLVQAVAFNAYGDRCATGSVDGKIRVFNRHRDGTWRLCDTWGAHGGEILELQWLPPTVYPNLVASLGIEGRFKLWAEDPSAAPGRRFSSTARSASSRAAFETRSPKSPYRSFSLRHSDGGYSSAEAVAASAGQSSSTGGASGASAAGPGSRLTHLALLAADGRLTVLENDQPENLAEWAPLDEFPVCARPARGEETAFRVRFDPNPEPCYAALRAGAPTDSLALVVAAMTAVKVYRSRDVVAAAIGVQHVRKEFYLAVEVGAHRGLVRDVAWAPGNVRGYDVVATACQDGFVRVFKIETPVAAADGEAPPRSWSTADLVRPGGGGHGSNGGVSKSAATTPGGSGGGPSEKSPHQQQHHHHSGLTASLARSTSHAGERHAAPGASEHLEPGQVRHVATELSRLDSHRTPVWRVDFNDDGQILGSTGDDGKLMCYRQIPDGSWAKSSELAMMKIRMAAP